MNWIDANKKLPSKNGKYLAFVDNPLYGIQVVVYSTEYGSQYHWNTPSGKVTHWQILPEEPTINCGIG